ncbi:hypothetical protein F4780DRAFT_725538 [Xylariomycetidae sp. FL0641]|nr:hypothetical protein F4780DRAFT_725538 [Xylariomycetidae sp. FL0641]
MGQSMRLTAALAALLQNGLALLVADGSSCATQCGNVLDATTPADIVCTVPDIDTLSAGSVFKYCVNCESTSTYVTETGNRTESDLGSMLYNLRYATNQCLYLGGSNPCSTSRSCGPLRAGVTYANLSTEVDPYDYCSVWDNFRIDQCTDCLAITADMHYILNFMSILDGACSKKIEPPLTIPIDGGIFGASQANVTTPTPTAQFASDGNHLALSNGAIAGISIGGLVFLMALFGCGVVINGKRRRKAYLRRREETMKNWPTPKPGGEMFETPLSQRPLRGWEDSPVSAATTDGTYPGGYPRYFSPYSSQYNSPVTAVEAPSNVSWPVEKAHSIGLALSPDHDDSVTHWGDKKGKDKAADEYELQEGVNSAGGYGYPPLQSPTSPHVHAPMLSHPVQGRFGPALQPQRNHSYSDHDEIQFQR